MRTRGLTALTAALVVLATVLAAPVSPATAGYEKWTTFSRGVVLDGQRKIAKHLCIEWNIKGTVKLRVKDYGKDGWIYYKTPRLVSPTVSIYAYDRCVGHYYDYRRKRTFYGADLAAIVYGSNHETCSWNPSLGLGFPWGVTVGVTPQCGQKTSEGRGFQGRIEPNKAVHGAYLRATGTATTWYDGGQARVLVDGSKTHNLCFAFQAKFTVYRQSGSTAGGVVSSGARTPWCFNIWDAASFN
jgi:hypothetical protein